MAVTEEERHELHSWLEDQAGPQIAATLMKHLPPVGWMDVTTNAQLESTRQLLDASLRTEIATVRTEIAEFRAEISDRFETQTRLVMGGLIGVIVANASITFGAINLLN